MNTAAEHVVYRGYSADASLRITRVQSPESLTEWTLQMCQLIGRAYANAYEVPRGPLPSGTVAERYSAEHSAAFTGRALEHMERGSQYWTIRAGRALLAFAKISPGEVLDEPKPGTVYVNDVVVDPGGPGGFENSQRRGCASALLHGALKFGGYNPNRAVVLEAFDASEDRMEGGVLVPGANRLYSERMGLVRVGPVDPFEFPNGTALPMGLYSTPEGMALDGVVLNLQRHYWPLTLGTPT